MDLESKRSPTSGDIDGVWTHLTSADHPSSQLLSFSRSCGLQFTDLTFARLLDDLNPVRHLRDEFHCPSMRDLDADDRSTHRKCIYLCGNSLGLQPKETRILVNEELEMWETKGVVGHYNQKRRPWITIASTVKDEMARIVGAEAVEVCLMNSLSVNLHVGMVAFYRPTQERYKVLMESRAFPSDHYAVQSQIQMRGFDADSGIITVEPREKEHTLRTEDIIAAIDEHGDSVALVLFSGVHFYTGQFFDLQAITAAAHSKGCKVGIDLAHAAGNVPLKLHEWEVDFACWCTYKYLNAGPGAIAGFFIHEKYATDHNIPRMEGWWGHDMETRFKMSNERRLLSGADGFQCSNPPILQMVSLLASLNVFSKTSMEELRATSVVLTGYLELLLNHYYPKEQVDINDPYVEVLTPGDIKQRGAQLSLSFSVPLREMHDELTKKGVVVDMREPNVMRVAPVPLYNSFEDVHTFVMLLGESFQYVQKQKQKQ